MTKNTLKLIENPRDKEYEDFVCSYFEAGGYYVEKSIICRDKSEILELDLILNRFQKKTVKKTLVEIKSGGWGFKDIFKVRGWMDYIGINEGMFVVKETKDPNEKHKVIAKELNIDIVFNPNVKKTAKDLNSYFITELNHIVVNSLRFSFAIETVLLKKLKALRKQHPEVKGYKLLDDYHFIVNSGSFFSKNEIERISKIFEEHIKNKSITAKLSHELRNGSFDDTVEELRQEDFHDIFYDANYSPLQIALYIEHLGRLTVFKTCVELLLTIDPKDLLKHEGYLCLPGNIRRGVLKINNDKYYYKYPIFWQFFTFVMGGFILTDYREKEYEFIANNTGIPVEEIPNAFNSFNKLFPREKSWMTPQYESNIEIHSFFPMCFTGVGVNIRRFIHLDIESDFEFEDLFKKLDGDNTVKDLRKWNSLGYDLLKNEQEEVSNN